MRFHCRRANGRNSTAAWQASRHQPISGPAAATAGESAGYLVDNSGRTLQGWAYTGAAAGPAAGGATAPMRVDAGAFADEGEPTTLAALGLNLPEADGDWAGELDGLVQLAAGGIVRIRFEPDLRLPDLAARVHRADEPGRGLEEQ